MRRLMARAGLRAVMATLVLFVSVAQAAEPELRDANAYFFDSTFGDFSEELQTAKAEGKKAVMIFFELDECPFCHRMRMKVLSRPDVQAYFKQHFRLYHVDVEGDIEITDFQGNATTMKEMATVHRVRATPVFQFFDLDGNPIKLGRYTGATRDHEEFLLLGQYVVEEAYKNERFAGYKKRARKGER